jgi:hypothetical protein
MASKGTWLVSMTLNWKYPQSAEETAVRTYEVEAATPQLAIERADRAAQTAYTQNTSFPVGYSFTFQNRNYDASYFAPILVEGTPISVQRIG